MIILGVDTCLDACSVALVEAGNTRGRIVEPMARGHQERLAVIAQAVMAQAGASFDQLDRIGVTVGPGSFTGLRVGLAFAKGLSQALGVPAVGVGTLAALAADLSGLVFAAIDARRGQLYLQAFEEGAPLTPPEALTLDEAAACLDEVAGPSAVTLIGSGAGLLAQAAPHAHLITRSWADPSAVARLAALRDPTPPRPLYLRAPDARLPAA